MKKNMFHWLILVLFTAFCHHTVDAQNGLEGIVVEKYYVANAADSIAADADAANGGYANGALRTGSVTYRIYADLLPGYNFQAVYGVPAHALTVTSSTNFYNNSTGGITPTAWGRNSIKNTTGNVLGLDSWWSVGGAASNAYGILKSEDNVTTGGAALITSVSGNVLQNSTAAMGIALTTQDGYYYSGAPSGLAAPVAMTAVGLSAAVELAIFNDGSAIGGSFSTTNGSLAALGGSTGPIPATNRVLIGQFTTDGVFHYELNIQVGTPGGGVQNFVASNPTGSEITIPSLTGTLGAVNAPPTVSVTAPTNGSSFIIGGTIGLTANAADANGTVTQVEFFVDGVSVGVDATAPYAATYTGVLGAHTVTAVATDNDGASTTSAVVNFTVVANPPPTCAITAPATGSSFITNDVVAITANATDNGSVSQVQFFVDGVSIGTDATAPYSVNYTAALGNHSLTAVATDNAGLTTTSAAVAISVVNNIPPTCSITAPVAGTLFTAPAVVAIAANAADADGTISQVEFLVNGVVVGTDATSPYSFNWTSVIGSANLTVRATDNRGAQTTSAIVHLDIADPNALPYNIVNTTSTCLPSSFCLPVAAHDTVRNVIGYDVVLNFNPAKVRPTGNITVYSDIVTPSYVDAINSIDTVAGKMLISLFFNGSAPAAARFSGAGRVFCVEFNKTANFLSVDTTVVTISSLQESYFNGVSGKLVQSGKFITYKDSTFNGKLRFWADNSAIKYNAANPNQYLITNIYGTDGSCNNQSAVAVQPDTLGNFHYNIWNGVDVSIQKDIPGTTDMQPVINGFDALLAKKVLLNDISFIPNIYNILSMDVNLDGVVSAGDVSQINQRAVLMIPEFKQAWNYNASGVSNGQLSKDWLFVDSARVNSNPAYAISSTYPSDNGTGFSKYRVPQLPFCLPVPVANYTDCPLITSETYKGILVGDINGNFATTTPNSQFRVAASDKVVFDLSKATVADGYVTIPVEVSSASAVNALDFAVKFNEEHMQFNSVVDHTSYLQSLSHQNQDDRTLRFTSYSIQNYDLASQIVSVRFALNTATIDASDLTSVVGYINGEQVKTEVKGARVGTDFVGAMINVYPNPANEFLNIEVSESAKVTLMDVTGRQTFVSTVVNANEKTQLTTAGLANGVYMLQISNDQFTSFRKVVIKN